MRPLVSIAIWLVIGAAHGAPAPDGGLQPDGGLEPAEPRVLPLYPSADEDFRDDQRAFTETETEPERLLRLGISRESRRVGPPQRPYQKFPRLTLFTEAALGGVGAGIAGVLGGNIGSLIDEGYSNRPLGGLRGPAIGGLMGTWLGSGVSVWGAGALFEKEIRPGMSLLGAGAGALVGGAAGFGVATLLEDEPQMASALAILLTVAAEIVGAMWLGEATLAPLTQAERGRRAGVVLP